MENNSWGLTAQWVRLIVAGSCIGIASILVWILLGLSSHASAQLIDPRDLQTSSARISTQPIRIEFVYTGDDLASVVPAANKFASLLSLTTGLSVTASVNPCESAVVEHLASGYTDLAPLSPVAYVHGHEDHGIKAGLVIGRFGTFSYRSQINVQSSRGYADIWDLQGKSFACPNPNSWSGYMVPYVMISKTTGINPNAFFGSIYFTGDHPQVIRDVYTGTADSGASFVDARTSVENEYPDVMAVVSVLTYSEDIPNSPWAFRPGLDALDVQTLSNGIVALSGTPEGEQALETIFEFDLNGIAVTQDSDYDPVKEVVTAFDLQPDTCYLMHFPILQNQ